MDRLFALLGLITLTACAAPALNPATATNDRPANLLGEQMVSLYANNYEFAVTPQHYTSALGLEADSRLSVEAVRIAFDDGRSMTVLVSPNTPIVIPGRPRKLAAVQVMYATNAPPDTYAKVRLFDLTPPALARHYQREAATAASVARDTGGDADVARSDDAHSDDAHSDVARSDVARSDDALPSPD